MAGSIIPQCVHETESRTIASRCPKLRTSKGHLVYERPPARSQLRSRKPIQRHACYNIHAAHMPCMNSRYHCNSLQSLHFIDITHIECKQRSRDRDPTLQQVAEANYVWVQTSLTNGLRSLIYTHALHEGTCRLTGTRLAWSWTESSFVELDEESTFEVSGFI